VTRATGAEASISADLAAEVSRATTAEGALDTRVSDIESNYLDKRVGGTISGDVTVEGTISATGGLEISGGGASTSLFVGDGVVGVNTETPSEALEVVGNGKFSGTVEVAAPTVSSHASTKGYVDNLFSKQQAFSVSIPVGTEQMTVSFPSEFSSVPVINASLEGEVVYFHVIKNKTVNGFDIALSDEVQEAGVVLNVFASNQ
jgi:cytoskeletal protein CcmA (bactofilin family)